MNRRDLFRSFAAGGLAVPMPQRVALAEPSGLPRLKITGVMTILTAPPYPEFNDPAQTRLTVVKVLTSEPGLYGLGCASFCFRPAAVAAAIDQYLQEDLSTGTRGCREHRHLRANRREVPEANAAVGHAAPCL